jgi:hypothetical protein
MEDIVHKNNCKLCLDNGKSTQASFGHLFEKKIYCSKHKLNNTYIKNNPKCESKNCTKRPLYGNSTLDILPIRCEDHTKDGDVNRISKECKNCYLEEFIPIDSLICVRCQNDFKKIVSQRGLKENKVRVCLNKEFPTSSIISDQKGECTRYRPDLFFKDFHPLFHVIVEVDERQHSSYVCKEARESKGVKSIELLRMINIFEGDMQGKATLFIRFNPDPYKYKGKVIKSYDRRERMLVNTMLMLKNYKDINFSLGVIYLFYDNFEENNIHIEPLEYSLDFSSECCVIKHKHPRIEGDIHYLNHIFPESKCLEIEYVE